MCCVTSINVFPKKTTINVGEWFEDVNIDFGCAGDCCSDIVWHSDNPCVASVNAANGRIYGISAGTARIYATVKDECNISDYITVTVNGTVHIASLAQGLSVRRGDCAILTADILPKNATEKGVVWSSDNECVATVHGGAVHGVMVGTAKITVKSKTDPRISASCTVKVTKDIPVTYISVRLSSASALKGKYVYASEQIYPHNATCKCVTWESSDTSVASVNPVNGTVFTRKAGTVTIRAKAQDGSGVVGEATLTVKPPVKVTSITVCPANTTIKVGCSTQLNAEVYPYNTQDKRIRWSSDNCNIADVDPYTGCVCGKSAGTTYIYANAQDGSGVRGRCEVTCYVSSGTDSIGVFRTLSLLSATPAGVETEAPVIMGMQFTQQKNGFYSIRFVSQIKTLHYKAVGFEIHSKFDAADSVAHIICSRIAYESLLAAGERVYPDNGFSYFVVGVMDNVPQNAVASFKIKPFGITLEGNFLHSDTTLFTCKNAGMIDSVDFVISNHLSAGDHIRVNTGNKGNLHVRSLPGENGTILGKFSHGTEIALVLDTPENEKWYAVYGRTIDGTYKLGWSSGEYLGNDITYAKSVYAATLTVRSSHSSNSEKLGTISNGDVVVLLEANCYNDGTYIWHKISYKGAVAYVVAELSVTTDKPNFDIYTEFVPLVGESDDSDDENNDVSTLTPISSNSALTQGQMENNAKLIYNYLSKEVDVPWSKNAICAVLGNMQDESWINPGKWQNGAGSAYGLVQWEYQQEKLFEYLELNGYEDDDLYGQLEYLIYQCERGTDYWNKGVNYPSNLTFMNFNNFRQSTTSVETLTRVFLWAFEKAGTTHEQKRINNANQWYSFFS